MGINWVTGTVMATRQRGTLSPHIKSPFIIAEIEGDNGTKYYLRENGFAPDDRDRWVKPGERVRFEDRQGYVLDLRKVG